MNSTLGSSFRICRLFAAAVVVMASSGCGIARGGFDEAAVSISIAELLGNERMYEGKRIHIAGYLGADMSLYLSKEHANAFDMESSFPISDTDDGGIEASSCLRSFVFLEARLEETDSDLFTLVDVSSVVQAGKGTQPCWSRT